MEEKKYKSIAQTAAAAAVIKSMEARAERESASLTSSEDIQRSRGAAEFKRKKKKLKMAKASRRASR